MGFIKFVLQDWKANQGNTKGRIVTCFFRIANFVKGKKILKILFLPYLIFYKIIFEWILGMEIPYDTTIGSGFQIWHIQSIVINKHTIIGKNLKIRHCLTIGNKDGTNICPVIGDNVDIGANVCLIGAITIGNNVKIGAGSVVVKSIPAFSVAVGNPAKVIKSEFQADV
ncbi:serine O-acetyltransferase [Mucilaginibacter litoreus]|uniref:Serine acetyltransferase n=1 Tax=Mucilaginibacter litoreus TaxID=1048221 RepID=A0ABW3AX32_9SPHI